jgi:hypothetical protein
VTRELHAAAPDLTRATVTLPGFAAASETALKTFGDAAEQAGPTLAQADPIVKQTRHLAETGVAPTKTLKQLLRSFKQTNGFESLMDLIYNTAGSVNGFDEVGHYLRTALVPSNCVDYVPGWQTGCDARLKGAVATGPPVTRFPGLIPQRPQAHHRPGHGGSGDANGQDGAGSVEDQAAEATAGAASEGAGSASESGDLVPNSVGVAPGDASPPSTGDGAPPPGITPADRRDYQRLFDFLVGQ